MNIVFIGSVKFSELCLRKMIDIGKPPVGVCTLQSSKFNSDHTDLTDLCKKNNIMVRYAKNINSIEIINWIKSLKPEVIFCFGWSRLLKKEILRLPKLGVIGYHPAKLPMNRGRHPLIWALALGLKETASSFFFMDEGADSGDILSQKRIKIVESDDASSLYKKMSNIATNQIQDFIPLLESGNFSRIPQDHSKSNSWRKRSINDGKIDWRMSARSIHNLVRALTHPYVGAHFAFENQDIKVWNTKVIKIRQNNFEPGKILGVDKEGPIIMTGSEGIKLIDIEPHIDFSNWSYL